MSQNFLCNNFLPRISFSRKRCVGGRHLCAQSCIWSKGSKCFGAKNQCTTQIFPSHNISHSQILLDGKFPTLLGLKICLQHIFQHQKLFVEPNLLDPKVWTNIKKCNMFYLKEKIAMNKLGKKCLKRKLARINLERQRKFALINVNIPSNSGLLLLLHFFICGLYLFLTGAWISTIPIYNISHTDGLPILHTNFVCLSF